MKKIIIPALSIGVLSLASISLSFNNSTQKVSAYSVANLPTTIDLNDNTADEIRNYYSALNGLSASERQGTNLLKNLKPILSNNQKYYSYESKTKIWQMYEITDRDWEKSPASDTTYGTYDAVNNRITGYQYGSNSNNKNNPYVHALYNDREIANQARAWGNHNQDGWGINQEHIWAKSEGFEAEGSGGARGDPMHLWAGNGYANNKHSNLFFAFVDKTKNYTDCGATYSSIKGNYRGFSKNASGGVDVFEPQDSDKGDIARAIFYMAARYNYYSGSDTNPIDSNNPNLILTQLLSDWASKGYTSSATNPGKMGLLSDLLAWNKLDPVDEYETHRNNLLYNNYTNNRNPFIDFPEWADYIWGTANLDGTNYNPAVTGSANPATDPIGQQGDQFHVSPTSIKFSVNNTQKVSGNNADDDITWTVDNPSIVSLSKTTSANNEEITVTALENGQTTIRASAYCGGDLVNRTINVVVKEKVTESLSLSGMKKEFNVGDKFSTSGLKVTANYRNGTSEQISLEDCVINEPDMSNEGEQQVIVTYDDVSATYTINIVKPRLPKYVIYIAIGVGAVVLVVLIIIFAKSSKKTKKKMISAVKKGTKSYKKSASKKK